MKRIILFLSAISLLLCVTSCDPLNTKNKGHFEKNIPKCLKKMIINESCIMNAKEYCNITDTKKIYIASRFADDGDVVCYSFAHISPYWFDEVCNRFYVSDLPDGTVEHNGEIYHFKRNVFTKKIK